MTTKKNIRFEPWVPFRKWKYDENTDEFFVEDETTVKCRRSDLTRHTESTEMDDRDLVVA